jgi:hypothetical protein
LIAGPVAADDRSPLEEFARQFRATRPLTPDYVDTVEAQRDDAA